MTESRRHSLPRASIASIKSTIRKVAKFRWIIFVIGMLASFSGSLINTSMSLTVVAMIKPHHDNDISTINMTKSVTNSTDVHIEPVSDGKIYVNWTNVDKSRMLQAAFWGTLITAPFGGRLCEHVGPRKLIALMLLTAGIANVVFPTVARKNFIGAYLIRVIQGMTGGINSPAFFVVIARWSTSDERTMSAAVVNSGSALGNLISLPLAGVLVSSSFLGGWPSVFYILGVFSILVSILWWFMVYDTPEQHPRLGQEELEEILAKRSLKSGEPVKVPWRKLFTSLPIYAYLVPSFTYGWCVAVVASQIPSFYEDILGFSREANGFVASLPWLVSMGSVLIGSSIADKIRSTNRFSLGAIRKTFAIIGLGVLSIGLIAITTMGKRKIPVVLTVAISKGMGTLSAAGSACNHLDIAPTFAGTLAGFSQVVSSIASLIANEGVARIVGNSPTQANWYRFFYISSAINAFGVIFFCLFGSGEPQPWDPSYARRHSVKSAISKGSRYSITDAHSKGSQLSIQQDPTHHITTISNSEHGLTGSQ